MAELVAFAGQLAEADTEGVPPAGHVVPLENVFRPDRAGTPLPRADLLAGAPRDLGRMLLRPQVVE